MKITVCGFTIIELLVSISVMLILLSLGVGTYNDFNRRQMVVQAAKELKNNIRMAQGNASAGQKDVSVALICGSGVSSRKLDRWEIILSATNYQMRGICGGTSFDEKTITLPTGITFSASSLGTITFHPLSGGSNPKIICISGFNKTYRLELVGSGEIKDDGFSTTCP